MDAAAFLWTVIAAFLGSGLALAFAILLDKAYGWW